MFEELFIKFGFEFKLVGVFVFVIG